MRCRTSGRLIPAAATLISTSSWPGSGTGRVVGTSISGPPNSLISIAVIVFGTLVMLFSRLADCHTSAHITRHSGRLCVFCLGMHSILRNATMTSDDDEDRSAQSLRGMNFDSMSIAELEDYITDLDTEIARAKSMIERKRLAQNAAAGFFKS